MDLYLHIGTEKTGSSYVQTLLALSRAYLEANGFLYPTADQQEQDMLRGKISPGNASGLFTLLMENKFQEIHEYIIKRVQLAQKKKCNSLILSNETLIEAVAQPQFETFIDILKQSGIQEIKGIVIIRDPIDHVLSMYKHRNKDGSIASFEHWLQNDYNTLHTISDFLKVQANYPIEWIIRKYETQNGGLKKIFFEEWLSMSYQDIPKVASVNQSLTLSEIHLLQKLYEKNTYVSSIISEGLTNIPKETKGKDSEIENYYRKITESLLLNSCHYIKEINSYLPENEKLNVPKKINPDELIELEKKINYISLSEDQVSTIIYLVKDLLSFAGIFRIIRRKMGTRSPEWMGKVYKKLKGI